MLPNYDLWERVTLNRIFHFTLRNQIPVVTDSKRYMKWGAVMSVSSRPDDIGRLLAIIIKDILDGKDVETMKPIRPENREITISLLAMRELFLTIPKEVLENARKWP